MADENNCMLVLQVREYLYRLLSRLYRTEVDEALLKQLMEMEFPVDCKNERLASGYKQLVNYMKHNRLDSRIELEVDYAKVFLGAGLAEGSAAFPYESVYTSPKKILMQEARDQVLEIYRAHNMDVNSMNCYFPADHISLELEFMGRLCQQASHFYEENKTKEMLVILKEQDKFLEKHLMNWIPEFSSDVEKYSSTDFYRAVAKMTEGYLDLDSMIVQSLIGDLES